jgi:hypothetical protein
MLTAGSMGISIDVNVIGYRNISLGVNNGGYLQTNILDTGKAFYIGEDTVRAFVDYIQSNGSRIVDNRSVVSSNDAPNDSQPQTIEPMPADSGIAPGELAPDDPLGYWTPERIHDAIGK